MFFCCSQRRPRQSYQVVKKNQENQTVVSYVSDIKKLGKDVTDDKDVKIRPVRMSDYEELLEQARNNKTPFQDVSFPPDQTSLGNLGQTRATWKRISQFLNKPTLFDDKIQPNDVVHNNVGDCYLLSAIAALAQNPQIIKTIFHGQQYNTQGIYRVVLSVDGVIQEVVVDDYIPLNQYNAPIFCQPTVKEDSSEFWTLILEKALAKVKGSYADIMEGSPSQIFRIVTYCPAESLVFDDRDSEKIWNLMQNCSGYNQPFCATTKDTLSKFSGLTPEHTYTVVAVATLDVNDMAIGDLSSRRKERVIKLRNPWAHEKDQGWKGRGGIDDREFWESVKDDEDYGFIRKVTASGDYGIFYMVFQDFCKFFNQIHYCNFHLNGKTVTEPLYIDKHHAQGKYFNIRVPTSGVYTFELNQTTIHKQTKEQRAEEGACRASLILMKEQFNKYYYVGGVMRPNQGIAMLTTQLQAGSYLLYAHLDPTRNTKLFPDSATVSAHSSAIVQITPADQKRHKNALKEAFLNDGLKNQKKMVQNNGLMTLSYRLLFQQGGYGYIVFHNEKESDKCFVVNYQNEEFSKNHMEVVEPAKHEKNFEMRVQPGHDMIILARAKDEKVESWKFPPKMNVKLEPLF